MKTSVRLKEEAIQELQKEQELLNTEITIQRELIISLLDEQAGQRKALEAARSKEMSDLLRKQAERISSFKTEMEKELNAIRLASVILHFSSCRLTPGCDAVNCKY